LARTATETLFAGAALLADKKEFLRSTRSSNYEDLTQARGMMKTFRDLTDEQKAALQGVIDRADPKASKYAIYDAARAAGLSELYETFYRGLSAMASHATFRSLDKSFTQNEGQLCLVMGPSDQGVNFTLQTIQTSLGEVIRHQIILQERMTSLDEANAERDDAEKAIRPPGC
jgi:hypothetical protein